MATAFGETRKAINARAASGWIDVLETDAASVVVFARSDGKIGSPLMPGTPAISVVRATPYCANPSTTGVAPAPAWVVISFPVVAFSKPSRFTALLN